MLWPSFLAMPRQRMVNLPTDDYWARPWARPQYNNYHRFTISVRAPTTPSPAHQKIILEER